MRFQKILLLAVAVGLAYANGVNEVAGIEDIPVALKVPASYIKKNVDNIYESDDIDTNAENADINGILESLDVPADAVNDFLSEISNIPEAKEDPVRFVKEYIKKYIDTSEDVEEAVNAEEAEEIENAEEAEEIEDDEFITVPDLVYNKKYSSKYDDDDDTYDDTNDDTNDEDISAENGDIVSILESLNVPADAVNDFLSEISNIPEAKEDPVRFVKEYIKKYIDTPEDDEEAANAEDVENNEEIENAEEAEEIEDDEFITVPDSVYNKKYSSKFDDDDTNDDTNNEDISAENGDIVSILESLNVPADAVSDFLSEINNIPEAKEDPVRFVKEYIKKYIDTPEDDENAGEAEIKDTDNNNEIEEVATLTNNSSEKSENKSGLGGATGAVGAAGAAVAAAGVFFWVKKSKKRDIKDSEEVVRMEQMNNIRDYEEALNMEQSSLLH